MLNLLTITAAFLAQRGKKSAKLSRCITTSCYHHYYSKMPECFQHLSLHEVKAQEIVRQLLQALHLHLYDH